MQKLDAVMAQRLVDAAASKFARDWWSEGRKIEEQVDDHEQRWAILLAALRQIGWPKEDDDG
jgi:hypothetical protein